MVKPGFSQFSRRFQIFIFVTFVCHTGCASSPSTSKEAVPATLADDSGEMLEASLEGWKKGPGFQARLSSQVVSDASILIVSVKGAQSVQGKFENTSLHFYPKFKNQDQPTAKIKYEGGFPQMFEAVVGIPYLAQPGESVISLTVQVKSKTHSMELPFQIEEGKYASEVLRVDPSKVKPPKKAWKRIAREIKEVKKIYDKVTPKKYWQKAFALPVESAVTSPFGTKRVYNGEMRSFHRGLDLRAPTGTPIRAPAAGVVVMSKSLYFTGNTVLLDHGYGVITLYAHMSKLSVRRGQKVKAGAQLGLSGATGRVNGPHLHWGAIINKVKVDPTYLTKVMR